MKTTGIVLSLLLLGCAETAPINDDVTPPNEQSHTTEPTKDIAYSFAESDIAVDASFRHYSVLPRACPEINDQIRMIETASAFGWVMPRSAVEACGQYYESLFGKEVTDVRFLSILITEHTSGPLYWNEGKIGLSDESISLDPRADANYLPNLDVKWLDYFHLDVTADAIESVARCDFEESTGLCHVYEGSDVVLQDEYGF